MKQKILGNKFNTILILFIILSASISYYRIYVAHSYDVFFITECEGSNCFVYEDEPYAFIQKRATETFGCTDESCLIDESCLESGSCTYLSCDLSEENNYSGYACN